MNAKHTPKSITLSPSDIKTLGNLELSKTTQAIRTHKILCDLFLLNDFKTWITEKRDSLKIPVDGYSKDVILMNGTVYDLKTNKEKPDGKTFVKKVDNATSKYILSKKYFNKFAADIYFLSDVIRIAREYMIFGTVKENSILTGSITYNKTGVDGQIQITVRSDIRKEELKKFIDDQWFLISEFSNLINPELSSKSNKIKKNNDDFVDSVKTYNQSLILKDDLENKGYRNILLARSSQKTADSIRRNIDRLKERMEEVNSSDI